MDVGWNHAHATTIALIETTIIDIDWNRQFRYAISGSTVPRLREADNFDAGRYTGWGCWLRAGWLLLLLLLYLLEERLLLCLPLLRRVQHR